VKAAEYNGVLTYKYLLTDEVLVKHFSINRQTGLGKQ